MYKTFLVGALALGAPLLYAADTIMACKGVSRDYGHHAPKRIVFGDRHSSTGDVLTLAADQSWAAGLLANQNVKLARCQETPTELVFSANCSGTGSAYVADWLAMSGQPHAEADMAQKYGESWREFETLRIDRVALTVMAEHFVSSVAHDYEKSSKTPAGAPGDLKETFFVRVTEYRGSCKAVKAQI